VHQAARKPPWEGRDTAFPGIRSPPKAGSHTPIRQRFSNRLLSPAVAASLPELTAVARSPW